MSQSRRTHVGSPARDSACPRLRSGERGFAGAKSPRPPLCKGGRRGDFGETPAHPIETEAHYKAALARIDGLMDAELGTEEGKELEALTALVEHYESKHVPMGYPDP